MPWRDAARSARRAAEALRLVEADGLVFADDHLTTLLLEHDPSLIAELAERRLAPLADATPAQRERLLETLGAWLLHHGSVPEVARAIHVHPQTVRYRLNQLRELFDLDDPEARFELLLSPAHEVSASGRGPNEQNGGAPARTFLCMSAEPAIELPVPDEPVPFNLDLSDDQRDIRDWVHGFAADVVRPAASEWDEKEETPWPIIGEAAKIGLYGFEALAQFYADPSGLTLPIVNEELFWGDAGIGMAIMGTSLAAAGIFSSGTPEQMGEWIPQCFGTPEDPKVGAFCVSEPDAGSDVSSLRTRAVYDEAKDEWVLNGQKAWATNGGIANVHVVVAQSTASSARAARPRS